MAGGRARRRASCPTDDGVCFFDFVSNAGIVTGEGLAYSAVHHRSEPGISQPDNGRYVPEGRA
jgi:hypothetical protein